MRPAYRVFGQQPNRPLTVLDGESTKPGTPRRIGDNDYMAVTLELPDNIAHALSVPGGVDLSRKALAIEGFREKRLSQFQVGQLLGLSRIEAENLLARHADFTTMIPSNWIRKLIVSPLCRQLKTRINGGRFGHIAPSLFRRNRARRRAQTGPWAAGLAATVLSELRTHRLPTPSVIGAPSFRIGSLWLICENLRTSSWPDCWMPAKPLQFSWPVN